MESIDKANYKLRIKQLFILLEVANCSDSNNPVELGGPREWQEATDSWDAPGRFYHSIKGAIVAIAGYAIVEHWAETQEIDYSLADR